MTNCSLVLSMAVRVRSNVRCLATRSTMSAWRLHKYGAEEPLRNEEVSIPSITRPNDVLIKVAAASLNPLDMRMKEGYGRNIIGVMRQVDNCSPFEGIDEFPLTLGRDCSGTVADVGRNVRKFKRGDEVWCAIGAQRQGSLAEYVTVDSCSVSRKPKSVDFLQAASLPYVGCTAWSALCTVGRLHKSSRRQSVLIHAGSGGIGTFAIQLAKVFNAEVTTTCSADAFDLVKGIGADNVVNYNEADALEQLAQFAPFDLIFDSVDSVLSRSSTELLGYWKNSMYISIANPLLRDADQFGLLLGIAQSASSFTVQMLQNVVNGRLSVWSYVIPSGDALSQIATFVDAGKIRPVVEKVYDFSQVPEALEKVGAGRGRGKLVVKMLV